MTRQKVLAGFAVVAIAAALSATGAVAADLTVTVTYTGKGKVDEGHEILVFLFNDPNITAQSVPLTVQPITKSGGTTTFKDLKLETVYVVLVYDEKGDYDGRSGPPPPGTPVGMHGSGKDGKPAPVMPAKTPKITTKFDDSRRWEQKP
jgi:uncharacterized protein (DUF2141 family)